MTLANPFALYLLFILPVIAFINYRRNRRSGVVYSSLSLIKRSRKTWRQRLLFLPGLLQCTATILTILCIARPQIERETQHQARQGIAIEIVFDISTSMDFSMKYGEENVTRMEVAKDVVKKFIAGDEELAGRPDDLLGLITFARYADTVSPMTENHQALVSIVDELKVNDRPNEDGTAYGDAVALGSARLAALSNYERTENINSKVLILLTDGENNSGQNMPLQAAALAKEWGVKVYTISIKEAPSDQKVRTADGKAVKTLADTSASDQILKQMAESTGGIFRSAFDYDSLQKVYKEIDQLEKAKLKASSFREKDDIFRNFLLGALLLLLLQIFLSATILRTTS